MSELHKARIAILASGNGSTAEAFIEAAQRGAIDVEVGLVVCNNPPEKASIYQRVARLNQQYRLDIEMKHINGLGRLGTLGDAVWTPGEQTAAESEAICELVAAGNFNLIALMGYMKRVKGDLLEEYGSLPSHTSPFESRMLNTHPGPLPQTQGLRALEAQRKVLEMGLGYSAHTVHVVAEKYDEGTVVASRPVLTRPSERPEELLARVQEVEQACLPADIMNFLEGRSVYLWET